MAIFGVFWNFLYPLEDRDNQMRQCFGIGRLYFFILDISSTKNPKSNQRSVAEIKKTCFLTLFSQFWGRFYPLKMTSQLKSDFTLLKGLSLGFQNIALVFRNSFRKGPKNGLEKVSRRPFFAIFAIFGPTEVHKWPPGGQTKKRRDIWMPL